MDNLDLYNEFQFTLLGLTNYSNPKQCTNNNYSKLYNVSMSKMSKSSYKKNEGEL